MHIISREISKQEVLIEVLKTWNDNFVERITVKVGKNAGVYIFQKFPPPRYFWGKTIEFIDVKLVYVYLKTSGIYQMYILKTYLTLDGTCMKLYMQSVNESTPNAVFSQLYTDSVTSTV